MIKERCIYVDGLGRKQIASIYKNDGKDKVFIDIIYGEGLNFDNVREFRHFLKMLLRFDERL